MNNKTDKGFQLNYWKLSYRRKFIRNLWLFPLCLVLAIFMFWSGDKLMLNRIVPVALLVLGGFELIYNYVKWNKHEKS